MAAVLVVDDDPDLRLLTVMWLRRAGHDVVGLGSGEEALARMTTAGAPDVVVLDVVMAGMSGLEVLAAMRADAVLREVPAIVLSGLVDHAASRHDPALRVAHLAKPVTADVLRRAVEDALASRALASSALPVPSGHRAG